MPKNFAHNPFNLKQALKMLKELLHVANEKNEYNILCRNRKKVNYVKD